MLRKMILAGMMTATVLGGIVPAYAQAERQRGERPQWGNRAMRSDNGARNDGAGRGWQQRRAESPDRAVAQPGFGGNWQGRQRPEQSGAERWQRDTPRPADNSLRGRSAPPRSGWTDAQRQQRQDWRDQRRDGRSDWRQERRDDRQDWRQDRRDDRRDWRNDRRDDDRRGANWNNSRWSNRDRADNRDWGRRLNDRARWSNQRRWDNGWRQDRRYDWQGYRARYGDRYRIGRYYAPRGWGYGYQRFSIGIYLNSLLYGNSYWLDDPYSYRLPPAYGTLRWVRYYDDALLVDIRDGYVVDVIHDFFW